MGKWLDFGAEAPRINLFSVSPGRKSSIKPSGSLIISSMFEGSPPQTSFGVTNEPQRTSTHGEASLRGELNREGG